VPTSLLKHVSFQLPILAISAILAMNCAPQPASLSHRPHPAYEVLLQTKGKTQFDRAVTARSKLFRGHFHHRNQCESGGGFALCGPLPTQQTHPGVGRFVADKCSSAIRLPYHCLVEAIFSSSFRFVLADC
jgi:hypothetical protein